MWQAVTPWRVLGGTLVGLAVACLVLILTMPRPPGDRPEDPVIDVFADVLAGTFSDEGSPETVEDELGDAAESLLASGRIAAVRITREDVVLLDRSQATPEGRRARPPQDRAVVAQGREHRVEVVLTEPRDLAGLRWRRGLLQTLTVALVVLSAGGLVVSRRRHAQQERLSLLDPLTGVGNRRQLERLATRLLREPSGGRRHALVLLDVDGFKEVNDRHGHARGDELLRRLAEELQAAVRPGDHVVRLGGDEFAVLLVDVARPGTTDPVTLVLERIRTLLPDIGVSAGGALWPDDAPDLRGLSEQADRAMYTHKSRREAPVHARRATPSAP